MLSGPNVTFWLKEIYTDTGFADKALEDFYEAKVYELHG
jgi:hypothetical protein